MRAHESIVKEYTYATQQKKNNQVQNIGACEIRIPSSERPAKVRVCNVCEIYTRLKKKDLYQVEKDSLSTWYRSLFFNLV
jgi:hypothetical protein